MKAQAVGRSLAGRRADVVAHLGVDKQTIATASLSDHRYLTIVADLDSSCVLYLADRRA